MSGILNAVEEANFQEVKRLVETGVEVNEKDDDGNTVLHYAASSCSQEIVEYLVEHGTDINCENENKETALHRAADHDSLGIVKYLVEQGADIHCKDVENNTALHYASYSGSLEVVKYLLECGVDVNCQNNNDDTPLHYAAELNSLEMIKDLVEHGADVNSKSKSNNTAINHAIKAGALDVVEYLVEHGANVNDGTGGNGSPLYSAIKDCEESSLNIVKYLVTHGADINFKDDWNKTALHYAVEANSLEIVEYLIEQGADVNCKTKGSATALHFAVGTGSLEMVKYLVENGAKVTTKQNRGAKTVLYWACERADESIVDFLLQHGAMEDVPDHDSFGRSCLSKACFDGSTALVRTLLKSGVDIRRETELQCRNEEIVNILNLELKSRKHRVKIENLNALDAENLTQVGPPLQRFCERKEFSLGKGSMGTNVYVGIMEDGSLVAVKRMLRDSCEDFAENENEILNLIETEHSPFIVKYRTFLKQSTFMYLILDLCEETLNEHVESKSIQHLRRYGPGMIKQILSGLEFLHGHNILHRDLKPLNVLVDITGLMRLADFGLSRVLNEDESTVHTHGKGTKYWMAPEVIEARNMKKKGRYKKKSDVHAAGMIAFFILTKGEHPFGPQLNQVTNILEGRPVNLKILEDLEAQQFISRLIHRNIDDRPYAGEALEQSFFDQVKNYEELSPPDILLIVDDSK